MTTIGGEVEQLASLKSTFEREGQTVQQLSNTIRGQLQSTWWKGPAADRFRSQWEGEFEPSLRRLHQALTECATEVNRRRDALMQAGS